MATSVVDSMDPLARSMKLSVGKGQGQSYCFVMALRSGQSPHLTNHLIKLSVKMPPADLFGVCRPSCNCGGRVEPHGIRVLTPSEIMRILPSIGSVHPAANYGSPSAHHVHIDPHQHLHQSVVAAGVAAVGGTVRRTLFGDCCGWTRLYSPFSSTSVAFVFFSSSSSMFPSTFASFFVFGSSNGRPNDIVFDLLVWKDVVALNTDGMIVAVWIVGTASGLPLFDDRKQKI